MVKLIRQAIEDASDIVNRFGDRWARVLVTDYKVTMEHGWIMPSGDREIAIEVRDYLFTRDGQVTSVNHVRG